MNLTVALLALLYLSPLSALNLKNADEMLAYVQTLLPNNPTILEAGGHEGEDTQRMKKVWPQATLHVFEPLPASFAQLVKTTEGLSNVICYPYALANFSGQTDFFIDFENSGASSIGHPLKFNESEFYKIPIQVPCITLDDWALANGISQIDFMWLDMEGFELYALQNASLLLSCVKAIFTEINFLPTRETCGLYKDLKRFLEVQRFREVWREDWDKFGNALFVR